MSYVKGINRDEYQMTCLDDYIEEDNKVRVIDAIVNSLDVGELGFNNRDRKNNSGRPEYDVFCMTKLYLLGYQNGIRSGRKLEAACKYDVRFQWLLENRKPDANTINDFRKNNLDYLKKMFYEVNKIYIKLGILSIKNVSQDGFKIKASNSKERNYTLNKLVDRIKREVKNIDIGKKELEVLESKSKETDKYLIELEKNEELEELESKIEEKKKELEEIENRRLKHIELVEAMKQEGINQISLTDQESKLMKNNGAFEVCYNNQTAVDMDTHLTVAIVTDDNPADIGSMATIADIMKREYGEEEIISNTTDKGYLSTTDMVESLEKGVIPQVTPLKKTTTEVELETTYEENNITDEVRSSTKSEDIKKCLRSGIIPECYEGIIEDIKIEEKMVLKENDCDEKEERSSEEIRETAIEKQTFERDINRNIVFCPAGEILSQKSKKKNGKIRYANKLACKNCKNPCTKCRFKEVDFSAGKKTLVPRENEGTKPRMANRKRVATKIVKFKLKLNPELLKKRMQTSEHSQGTMKTVDNHRYFHMRGKEKVSTEMALYFTASNIRRVCNMVGVKELLEMVKNSLTNKERMV